MATAEQQRKWAAKNRDKMAEYYRRYREKHPDRVRRVQSNYSRKRLYGLSPEAFTTRIEEQEGRCLICREVVGTKLSVDHNHVTGEIRGLLCGLCNSGLGMFKDNPARLTAAIAYLRRFSTVG